MFRIVEDMFADKPELHEIAVFCLTETIISKLEEYFYQGYEEEPNETLYRKVDGEALLSLLPFNMATEIENLGIDVKDFLAKKVAQMMIELKSSEEITFDLFNEYLLSAMIEDEQLLGGWTIVPSVQQKVPRLRELLFEEVKENLVYMYDEEELSEIDEEQILEEVEEGITLLTDFTTFADEGENWTGFVFWDYDYKFLERWGLVHVLQEMSSGVLKGMGYTPSAVDSIFSEVGEDASFLSNR